MIDFGAKAETLEALRRHLRRDRLCESVVFDNVELMDHAQELDGQGSVLSAVEELSPGVGEATAAFPAPVVSNESVVEGRRIYDQLLPFTVAQQFARRLLIALGRVPVNDEHPGQKHPDVAGAGLDRGLDFQGGLIGLGHSRLPDLH